MGYYGFTEESGARGRNRTTDTRIFNGGGVNCMFKINNLRGEIFGVCASVFLVSF
jgi:hypothetical protein